MVYKISLLHLLCPTYLVTSGQKIKSSATKTSTQSSVTLNWLKKLDSIFYSFNQSTHGFAATVLEKGKVIAKKAPTTCLKK